MSAESQAPSKEMDRLGKRNPLHPDEDFQTQTTLFQSINLSWKNRIAIMLFPLIELDNGLDY